MKCRDISKIDITKSRVKPSNKYNRVKNLIGLDTETEKGECFLLGYYSRNKKEILPSTNPDIILEHLNKRIFKESFNFFYNLTYDFQAIIKTLPYKNIKELSKRDKTVYKDYYIKWIPNKMFAITKTDKIYYSKFYDLMQFFNYMSLNKASDKFIKLKKISLEENKIDIKNLSYERYKNEPKYRQILNSYLRQDCKLTYLLAKILYNMTLPYIKPKYFYSQASFGQQYFLENIDRRMNLPSKKILKFALESYQGGRFEVFKKGFFDKGNIYDIKSAYPYWNIQVPDVSKGKWKNNKNYDGESLISLFKVNTDIHDIHISPMKYQLQNNLLIYPTGKFKDVYINKKEYELIDNLGFKIKIKKAWHFFDKEPEYPYTFLKDFYELKEKYKRGDKSDLSWIPKIIMTSFYGKAIQTSELLYYTKMLEQGNDKNLLDVFLFKGQKIYEYKKYKAGILFNPIVANEITANTRIQLYEAVKKNMNKIIGIQTDSVITDKKINLNFGDKLGEWEKEKIDKDIVILGSGVYQVLGDNTKIKMRGFKKSLDLYDILRNNPYNTKYEFNLNRNYKLKKTFKMKIYNDEIITDKKRKDLFNLILKESKTLNINFDKKRYWHRDFEDFKDVLNSQIESSPIEI